MFFLNLSFYVPLGDCTCFITKSAPPVFLITDAIIDLHHDIVAFLILLSIILMYTLLTIVYFIHDVKTNNSISLYCNPDKLIIFFSVVFILILSSIFLFNSVHFCESNYTLDIKLKIIEQKLYQVRNSSDSYQLVSVNTPLILPSWTTIQLVILTDNTLSLLSVPAFDLEASVSPGQVVCTTLYTGGCGTFYGKHSSNLCPTLNSTIPFIINVIKACEFEKAILYTTDVGLSYRGTVIEKNSFLQKYTNMVSVELAINRWRKKNNYLIFFSRPRLYDSSFIKSHFLQRAGSISETSILFPNFRPVGIKSLPPHYLSNYPDHHRLTLTSQDFIDYFTHLPPSAILAPAMNEALVPVSSVASETGVRLDEFMLLSMQSQYPEEFKNNQYGARSRITTSFKTEVTLRVLRAKEKESIKISQNIERKQSKH